MKIGNSHLRKLFRHACGLFGSMLSAFSLSIMFLAVSRAVNAEEVVRIEFERPSFFDFHSKVFSLANVNEPQLVTLLTGQVEFENVNCFRVFCGSVIQLKGENIKDGKNLFLAQDEYVAQNDELFAIHRQASFAGKFPKTASELDSLISKLRGSKPEVSLEQVPKITFTERHLRSYLVFSSFSIPQPSPHLRALDLTMLAGPTETENSITYKSNDSKRAYSHVFERFRNGWRMKSTSTTVKPSATARSYINNAVIEYPSNDTFTVTTDAETDWVDPKRGKVSFRTVLSAFNVSYDLPVRLKLSESIPNGTRVDLVGNMQIKASWKDGEVVSHYDKDLVNELSASKYATDNSIFRIVFWVVNAALLVSLILFVIYRKK